MLKLNEFKLSSSEDIILSSYDTILELDSDIDSSLIGIMTFVDGSTKIYPFVIWGDTYKCRITLEQNDINKYSNASFKVKAVSEIGVKQTNSIMILFNRETIALTMAKKISTEHERLETEIAEIKNKVNQLVNKSSVLISDLNLVNKGDIKKGMIPVATGDGDKFIVTYPFYDVITEVNKQKAVNGIVEIDASMIKYKEDKTLLTTLEGITTAIMALKESVLTITDNQKQLASKLDNLTIAFEAHKNTSIV